MTRATGTASALTCLAVLAACGEPGAPGAEGRVGLEGLHGVAAGSSLVLISVDTLRAGHLGLKQA